MSEREIIKRCLNKDKTAWSLFIQKYSRLVYWAIHRRLNLNKFEYNETDVEDIFQEVFLTVLKGDRLFKLKDCQSISGWLAMIASSRAVDFIRQKTSRRENLNLDSLTLTVGAIQELSLFSQDIDVLLKEVIDSLPDRERAVISLNLLEGKTHKEIGEILNIPVNTVSTIISRTKEKLKEKLQDKGIDENFKNI